MHFLRLNTQAGMTKVPKIHAIAMTHMRIASAPMTPRSVSTCLTTSIRRRPQSAGVSLLNAPPGKLCESCSHAGACGSPPEVIYVLLTTFDSG